jgi:uncharacterized protein YndB with AHSA1/START domain
MKKTIKYLSLVLLALTACNYKGSKPDNQEKQNTIMKELIIERQFDIEPEKVFKAFSNPKDMIVWWTPDTKFDIDLRVGGNYKITREENDSKLVMTGKYLEVERPYKLKYTCGMLDYSPVIDTIIVEIEANNIGGSKLRFIQQGEGINEELNQLSEGMVSDTEKGWNYGFDLMEKSWKENK